MTPLPIAEPRAFSDVLERMFAEQEHRHAWLFRAGEQIRKWKEEDAANGEPWGASIESRTHSQPGRSAAQEAAPDCNGD